MLLFLSFFAYEQHASNIFLRFVAHDLPGIDYVLPGYVGGRSN